MKIIYGRFDKGISGKIYEWILRGISNVHGKISLRIPGKLFKRINEKLFEGIYGGFFQIIHRAIVGDFLGSFSKGIFAVISKKTPPEALEEFLNEP